MDEFFIAFANDNPSAAIERKPDWGLLTPLDVLQEAFWIFYVSDFKILPYSGGWMEQPIFIRRDFRHCLWGISYMKQQMKKKGASELPTFAEKFGIKTKSNDNGKNSI